MCVLSNVRAGLEMFREGFAQKLRQLSNLLKNQPRMNTKKHEFFKNFVIIRVHSWLILVFVQSRLGSM